MTFWITILVNFVCLFKAAFSALKALAVAGTDNILFLFSFSVFVLVVQVKSLLWGKGTH
jgi:hypothetical protein